MKLKRVLVICWAMMFVPFLFVVLHVEQKQSLSLRIVRTINKTKCVNCKNYVPIKLGHVFRAMKTVDRCNLPLTLLLQSV